MNSGKILSGKKVAEEIRAEAARDVAELAGSGVRPQLDVVLVGDDPASKVYVGSKARACDRLGMASNTHRLPEDVAQARVLDLVHALNADPEVDGILVQLPLPGSLDTHRILDAVDPAKDVDGFHPTNVGLLQQGRPRLVPCTPLGIMELLRREGIGVEGRRAVVVGRSDIVGKPMAMLLLHAHATVTLCHSRTRDLASVTRQAEILIVAAGRRALIGPDHVAEGAVVIDVGMHRLTTEDEVESLFPGDEERRRRFADKGSVLTGDVDFVRVLPRAARITPVPGGVGPLTIAKLMANTVAAARWRRGV
ncbi:MAG: bifunctional methylenetetrahydrofolate dehydrogenase/methenyltetrahydrofolate cyclohydrolase FolD [Acidobacteria bacterium]|jgi:methylenetetrahydrofolate dehydrogenase (NADP+)/methenyltetrahydrofolate cyclohydrolase|nr:bifunctional methylenetetrahydrofolate dehydrogenase/methenyltetrahydrofolate cyclohydrolase FolD [Acidobacteriota bacterium]